MNDAALDSQLAEQPDAVSHSKDSTSALPASSRSANWWRIADFGLFGLWVAVTGFTLSYHEKWADEAQAWLIARDLSLWRIFSYELRYEGSPGLWHLILWIAQHALDAPYAALGPIGLVRWLLGRHSIRNRVAVTGFALE